MVRPHRLLLAIFLASLSITSQVRAVEEPREIRDLAGMIKPGASKKGNDETYKRQYFGIINRLRKTWVEIGLRPADQIERACILNNSTPTRKMLLRGALVDAYDQSDALGLFDPGNYEKLGGYVRGLGGAPKATKGTDPGKAVTIVPYLGGAEYKAFARDLANWRVTVEGETLSADATAAHERIAQNRKVMMTQAGAQENEPLEEKAEQEKEFKAALESAGNQTAGRDSLSVRCQLMETPNKTNKETAVFKATISNSAALPVVAKVEWMFIGRSPEKKKLVNLGSKEEDLKILPKQWHDMEQRSLSLESGDAKMRGGVLDGLKKPRQGAPPRYLGWILRVADAEGRTLVYRTSGLAELDELARDGSGLPGLRAQASKK